MFLFLGQEVWENWDLELHHGETEMLKDHD